MVFARVAAVVVCVLLPAAAMAVGGHDGLECTGCHGIHTAKGDIIFAVEPNTKDVNPKTKQPYKGITALCLGCHQSPDKGGQGIKPIAAHMSHPYGLTSVNPKIARVPEVGLRDGKFECIGCHDPHPSNPFYKYLRFDPGANGANIGTFCAACHPMKADPKAAGSQMRSFTSMDEQLYGTSAAMPVVERAEAQKKKAAAPQPQKKP